MAGITLELIARLSALKHNTSMSQLQLSYWERTPPHALLAAVALTGAPVSSAADPKFTKASLPKLSLPDERYIGAA